MIKRDLYYDRIPTKSLREDVRYLGLVLGKVIKDQEGEVFFKLVEKIRKLSKTNKFNSNSDKGATGLSFPTQTVKSLVEAIEFFKEKQLWRDLNPELIRDWSNSFSQDSFKFRFEKTLKRVWNEHINSCDIATSDLRS